MAFTALLNALVGHKVHLSNGSVAITGRLSPESGEFVVWAATCGGPGLGIAFKPAHVTSISTVLDGETTYTSVHDK